MLLKINEDLNGDGDPMFPAQRRVCSQTGAIRAILDVKHKTTWSNLFLTKKLYELDMQIGDLPINFRCFPKYTPEIGL